MLDPAWLLKMAVRITRVAAVTGLPGAAAVTVKETLPFLMKLAVGILISLIAVPIVIFTALPSTFFGYESSSTEPVVHMTQQAMTIGGVHMSLKELGRIQVDFAVTSIIQEYENRGEITGHIEATSHLEEDDLPWLIAINSIAHQ